MLNIGGWELMVILLLALVVLGPERLPDVARQLGQTMSSLRSLASNFQAEITAAAQPDVDPSMTLTGPTPQDEAIQQTQQPDDAQSGGDAAADAGPPAGGIVLEPFDVPEPFSASRSKTDPATIAAAARKVTYSDDSEDAAQSHGGPSDLRDEEE